MYPPDFIDIQRDSFSNFLENGLIEEISKRNPITSSFYHLELLFYPEFYQFNPPDWNTKEAILKSKTYAGRIYIPAQLSNKQTKQVTLQWVLLGNLPLMTKRGHFIINGSPRLIINQMVRSPGIYYHDKNKKRNYYADLISYRGTWLRLEIDKKKMIWAKMKKTPKIPILLLLQAMGLTSQKIFQSIQFSEYFGDENHLFSKDQALLQLYIETHPKKEKGLVTSDNGQKFLFRKFLNSRTYDLGLLGRKRLKKKLGLSTANYKTILTPEDILYATDYLIKLENGFGETDDIDNLKNRRVRASGEILQNQIGIGLLRLEKYVREKIKKIRNNSISIKSLITTKAMNGALREFFGSSQLSQFMDQTNPLAEITHKRRITSLGPGGVSRETAGMAVRGIHPTHYGRICPIETPEGPNAGLVNSVTIYSRVDRDGFLETPFYRVYKGQVQKNIGPIFFSAFNEEEKFVVPGDFKISSFNFLPEHRLPTRITTEFKKIFRNQVEYMALSPIQMISIATSLIPFLEHDDGNRALMGSNMQRQAVPLISGEKPIVGTGLESRVISDSDHGIQSKMSGYICYVSGEKIVALRQVDKIEYLLQNYQRSNQETCLTQTPIAREGIWVEKGDLLADGGASNDGELSLGKNILIAYMGWEGYNFEDAILISENLVGDEKYTSIHIERFEVEIRDTKFGIEQITKKIPDLDLLDLTHLDQNGIAKIGSFVKEGDILVGKVTPINKKPLSPHEKLLYDIVGKEIPTNRDSSLRVPKGVKGRVINIEILETQNLPQETSFDGPGRVHIYLAEKRKIQVGDKMAGRHGNKGIISKILPRQDLPFLPDGTPVDMVLNPLGVPSRMNVGQVLECLLGLAGKKLGQIYKIMPFDEKYGPETSRSLVYSQLYAARKTTGEKWLFNPNFPGKIRIFDGRTGENFDQPVTVGYGYMLKLIHLVDEKIHARSTGPYSLVTQQPLRGRSKHGGQRLGEMEVWALEGFGAAYTLQELLTIKSDDMKGRHQVMDAILKNKPISLGTPESFKVLIRELQSLCLDVRVYGIDTTGTRKQIDVLKLS